MLYFTCCRNFVIRMCYIYFYVMCYKRVLYNMLYECSIYLLFFSCYIFCVLYMCCMRILFLCCIFCVIRRCLSLTLSFPLNLKLYLIYSNFLVCWKCLVTLIYWFKIEMCYTPVVFLCCIFPVVWNCLPLTISFRFFTVFDLVYWNNYYPM